MKTKTSKPKARCSSESANRYSGLRPTSEIKNRGTGRSPAKCVARIEAKRRSITGKGKGEAVASPFLFGRMQKMEELASDTGLTIVQMRQYLADRLT